MRCLVSLAKPDAGSVIGKQRQPPPRSCRENSPHMRHVLHQVLRRQAPCQEERGGGEERERKGFLLSFLPGLVQKVRILTAEEVRIDLAREATTLLLAA